MSDINKHPSYGMIRFCRATHGSATSLFGSSIQHRNTVKMYLTQGTTERVLNNDYYSTGQTIAEVEMSYSQFAEAISSMGTGGVPVTLRYTQATGTIPECPFVDKRGQFEAEFKQNIETANSEVNNLIAEVTELLTTGKAFTKADKLNLLSTLNKVKTCINDSESFIVEQFNEQVDKTTLEAKGEIEAFMQNKINSVAASILSKQTEELGTVVNPVTLD